MMKSRQNARRSRKKLKKAKKRAPKASVDDLLKAASAAIESLDVERAYQAYYQAASQLQIQREKDITDTNKKQEADLYIYVLEKMGECQVSLGDQDLAKDHFLQSLRLLEEGDKMESARSLGYYETYSSLCFYIGQLSLGKEALEAYQRGIHSLEECMQGVGDKNSATAGLEPVPMQDDNEGADNDITSTSTSDFRTVLKQKASGAYCNLAELYLTDLCEEETAEADCEHCLEKALQLLDDDGEPLVDALQTMASLRLSQKERQLEAVTFILRAYEKQRVGSEALATLVGLDSGNEDKVQEEEQAQELVEVEAANNLPEFEFRCQTAKLLLECAGLLNESRNSMDISSHHSDQEDECIAAAICVLGSLLAQNDEVIEIWFLTGCAFAAKKPPLTDTARFYLERAKEMLADIRKAFKEELQFVDDSERPDLEERLEMNVIQMNDVQSKLDELPDKGEDSSDQMIE
jgi:tetratricopeptide (TPR) repeat protein